MSHVESGEHKILYLVEDLSGNRWSEWLYLYQVESYVELGYTVKEMHDV
jgi:hypothetical protein